MSSKTRPYGFDTINAAAEQKFSDGLCRYSVGIEDVGNLIADLRQVLDSVCMKVELATVR